MIELINLKASKDLESQVCSIENSIKLRSLGVKQNSTFYWYPNELSEEVRLKRELGTHYLCFGSQQIAGTFNPIYLKDEVLEGKWERTFSAFTLQELVKIISDEPSFNLLSWIQYSLNGGHSLLSSAYDVNAIAKVFIKHLEEKEDLERKEFLEKHFKENPPYIPGSGLDKLNIEPLTEKRGEVAWFDFK